MYYHYFNKKVEQNIQKVVSDFSSISASQNRIIRSNIYGMTQEMKRDDIQEIIDYLIDIKWTKDMRDEWHVFCYLSTVIDMLEEALNDGCYADYDYSMEY